MRGLRLFDHRFPPRSVGGLRSSLRAAWWRLSVFSSQPVVSRVQRLSPARAGPLALHEVSLTVRFDPRPWLQDVDFEALVEDADCVPGGPPIVCAGGVELTCSADGSVDASPDCESLGLACVREAGCVERLQFEPESQGYRAVRGALVSGARPVFEWTNAP